ncbi:MAG: hypothetical protein EXQ80_06310 [Candidatus Nanopelagicaceae bacterium]|nr:hypothetical protein [Candidatus Nanopelagicaceae bacterium]
MRKFEKSRALLLALSLCLTGFSADIPFAVANHAYDQYGNAYPEGMDRCPDGRIHANQADCDRIVAEMAAAAAAEPAQVVQARAAAAAVQAELVRVEAARYEAAIAAEAARIEADRVAAEDQYRRGLAAYAAGQEGIAAAQEAARVEQIRREAARSLDSVGAAREEARVYAARMAARDAEAARVEQEEARQTAARRAAIVAEVNRYEANSAGKNENINSGTYMCRGHLKPVGTTCTDADATEVACPNGGVAPTLDDCAKKVVEKSTGTAPGTSRSDGARQIAQIATFNPRSTIGLKIQGKNVLDVSGIKIGELAKGSNGQELQAAPPPPIPSTGGKAAPKKPTKTSSAPVIVMNVLGADNKEILGPDGNPLQTAPIIKNGNFVFTDRKGLPIMATPTLNAGGEPLVHNGKVLMTRLLTIGGQEALLDFSGKPIMSVPLLGEDGKPLLAPNGEVLYAPPLVNAAGNTIINPITGQAVLARPMADSSGNAALGADKKPFMGQPLVTKENKLLTMGGQEIYTGAAGMPLTNAKKQQIQTANKLDVQFGFGGTLIDEGGNTVLGPDGKPIMMNANATPLMSNGLPLLDKKGKAIRVAANGQISDSTGRIIFGADGKAMTIGKSESAEIIRIGSSLKSTVKAPDGSNAVIALNAQLFDKSGNPILTKSGLSIFYDGKLKKLTDSNGNPIKSDASGKVLGESVSLAFQTVAFAA